MLGIFSFQSEPRALLCGSDFLMAYESPVTHCQKFPGPFQRVKFRA